MKYFVVTAKCGHVGRGNYIQIDFPVRADSKTEAAKIVRDFPRVKHHHKDAILDCREVSFEEFNMARKKNREDTYLSCHSSTEQRLFCDIEHRILKEPKIEARLFNRNDKIEYILKKQKIVEKDCELQCKYALY